MAKPYRIPDFKKTEEKAKEKSGTLTAFLTGKAIPIEEVGDGVFSAKIMGDGMAILPESGILYAPVDAVVAAVMPESKHACGLRMENGMEMILHIGIDTVKMQGDGFEYLIEDGQKVCAGTPLIRFDRSKIRAAGHPDVTVCIITDQGSAQELQFYTGIDVKANQTAIAAFK